MAKVGTLERNSPLPPGQYWIDIFGLNIPKFINWLTISKPLGVHVDATQHFENTEVSKVRDWYKFSVSQLPNMSESLVVWDTTFGFPTVADDSIKSSDDTVQKPIVLDPLDELSNWVNALEQKLGGSLGTVAGIIPYALLGGAAYLGFKLFTDTSGVVRKVRKLGTRKVSRKSS